MALPIRMRLTVLGAAASVGLLSPQLAGCQRATTHGASLAFTVHLDGRDAAGVDDVWRGALDTPDAGLIAVHIEVADRSPAPGSWSATALPVHALIFVSHDNVARSFAAEATGPLTEAGTVHFTGTVDIGAACGAAVDVTMQLDGRRRAGHGTIRFLPVRAGADRT